VKHDDAGPGISDAASAVGIPLPPGAGRRLEEFEALLVERGIRQGLVARSDAPRIRERHILDCLRAVAAVEESDVLSYDIGSGAGLPGVVVAIARPFLAVHLVEPRRSRVAFLELVVDTLGVRNAVVASGRVEDQRGQADLCFARAFAPLPQAWSVSRPLLRPGGRLVYFMGGGSETPAVLEGASRVDVLRTPLLACSGPLTIMTR
jgi:16S rRNA (guanine527-N7)-methyltransferase